MSVRLDPPVGGWHEPWPTVFEIAAKLAPAAPVLVGGLMVQVHAQLADIGELRPTRDVDILIDLLAGDATVAQVAGQLRQIGFELRIPLTDGAPAHRFIRGDDVVDLLVPDHQRPTPRLGGRSAMQIDAGRQALGRLLEIEADTSDGLVTIRIPDLLGALILKAAAHRVDPRDRDRHLRDAALLAAAIDDPLVERDRMTSSDLARAEYIAAELADPFQDAWQLLSEDARERGRDTIQILASTGRLGA